MKDIERRLATALKKERRDAICYALLILLFTPFLVALISLLISLAVMMLLGSIFRLSPSLVMDARAFYGCVSLFLAAMAGLVQKSSGSPDEPHAFDVTWLAGTGLLLLLVYLTFATSLFRARPYTFAIIYISIGLLALALFGRSYIKTPFTQDADVGDYRSLPLAFAGFIAMAYGEVASSSWLWFPPHEDEVRVAAWILHKLQSDDKGRLDIRHTDRRILGLLFRLKYVRIRNGRLRLTHRGYDLVKCAGQKGYAVE